MGATRTATTTTRRWFVSPNWTRPYRSQAPVDPGPDRGDHGGFGLLGHQPGASSNSDPSSEPYRVDNEEVRALIAAAPVVNTQHHGFDRRISDWYAFVLDALRGLDEAELIKPGLTPLGATRLADLG